MSERVTMPALGESVTEGTVSRWLKSVGDTVEVDEPLLEVSTDKVDTEIPSPVAGTLQEILVQEDETVEVGAELAVVGEGDAAPAEGDDADSASQEEESEPEQSEPEPEEQDVEEQEPEPEEQASRETESAPAASSGDSGSSGGTEGGQTITMPALGESVTEGTVSRWLKSEGDQVEVDEPLLEVSTDKVDTEIPSPAAGTLSTILVQEDETVEVGAELAVIGGSGGGEAAAEPEPTEEQAEPEPEPEQPEPQQDEREPAQQKQSEPEPAQQKEPEPKPEPEPAQQEQAEPAQASAAADVSAYVTPLVRKLAAQHDIDLAALRGTGVGGRIRKQDVLDAAAGRTSDAQQPAAEQSAAQAPSAPSAPAAPAEAKSTPAPERGAQRPQPKAPAAAAPAAGDSKRGTTQKMSRLRKLIATRMVESLQVSAQLTTVVEVDVTKITRLRDRTKADFQRREGVKLSFMPFFAVAVIDALKQHPNVNASLEDDSVVYHAQQNLSVAVDTEKGLIVPVIKDAGELNIAGLARKIADVAERTRTNKVTPDELGGGTFTLTNTGSRGALFDTPIINQPQVGILGTGSVVRRPVVVSDEEGGETIAVRSMVYLALTYDHRIVDGADAARFLETVKHRLEEGNFEV